MLKELFDALKSEQQRLTEKHNHSVPVAVKIAPDLSPDQVDEFAQEALSAKIDAVIATNTTFSRVGVETSDYANETGGLSGAPVENMSTEVVNRLGTRLANQIPIIGVGGIHNREGAKAKFAAGASLIQVYTGLIYEGPTLVTQLIAESNSWSANAESTLAQT